MSTGRPLTSAPPSCKTPVMGIAVLRREEVDWYRDWREPERVYVHDYEVASGDLIIKRCLWCGEGDDWTFVGTHECGRYVLGHWDAVRQVDEF